MRNSFAVFLMIKQPTKSYRTDTTLPNPRLLRSGKPSDGDSLHVRYQERQYIFRLYFVDAPESDAKLKERVQDPAAYFSLSAGDIPSAGELAAGFTRQKLLAQPFTVITQIGRAHV